MAEEIGREEVEEALVEGAEELLKMMDMPGWKILMGQLDSLAAQAREDLETADPFTPAKIIRLQNIAKQSKWYREVVQQIIRGAIQPELIFEGEQELQDETTEYG